MSPHPVRGSRQALPHCEVLAARVQLSRIAPCCQDAVYFMRTETCVVVSCTAARSWVQDNDPSVTLVPGCSNPYAGRVSGDLGLFVNPATINGEAPAVGLYVYGVRAAELNQRDWSAWCIPPARLLIDCTA